MVPLFKSRPISGFFLLAASVAIVALPAARAEVNTGGVSGETKSLHEFASFPRPVLDPPGAGAYIPVDFFNGGTVDLDAILKSGTTSGHVNVSVNGYPAGAYTVSVVTESSSATVVLGSLTVTSGSFPNPFNGHRPVPEYMPIGGFTGGAAKFGGTKNPFPNGFNPFDVATLSLTDSNSNVVATATLTPVPSGFLNQVSPLVDGTAAPGATGNAIVRAVAQRFSVFPLADWGSPIPVDPHPVPPVSWVPSTGHIAIHAQGLPASASLTYAADGVDLGPVTTGTDGALNIFATQGGLHPKLPSTLDLFSVKTVTVHDASGTVYVSAGF